MTPLFQPKGTRQCGQAVVAMILDAPLSEAILLVGTNKGTQAKDLRRALARRGVGISDSPRLTAHEAIPARAILRLSRPRGNNWHWLLQWDGQQHDPAGADVLARRLADGWKITSFLEVFA